MRNASVRAVHAPKLLTECLSLEPEFISLRVVFAKALDCARTVRILKGLASGRYFLRGTPTSWKYARMSERGQRLTAARKLLGTLVVSVWQTAAEPNRAYYSGERSPKG